MGRKKKVSAIAVGASAGGVESLSKWISKVSPEIGSAIFVTMHFPQTSTSMLPHILERAGRLPAKHATDGEHVKHGVVYVAPPGSHLLIQEGIARLSKGPKENGHRPAIDPLFRSIGHCYGEESMGIILSGLLDDGAVGMSAIKAAGGVTAVQDPQEAMFGDMPRNAISNVEIDHILALDDLAHLTNSLSRSKKEAKDDFSQCEVRGEGVDPTLMTMPDLNKLELEAKPSIFTCPECHGNLFEQTENGVSHFRCRVGHAYTSKTLAANQGESLEAALWAGLRAIEENVSLMIRLRDRAFELGHEISGRHYSERVEEGRNRSELLRRFLLEWNERSVVS